MKDFNTSIGLKGPSLGKYRRAGAFLTLFLLFFAGNLKAQGGCGDMTPSFINYEPCKYRVKIVNTSIDCFAPTITVIIDQGAFETWSANTAGGWTGQEVAPNIVQLTHSGPKMPIDESFPMIFTLPTDLVTLGNFTWEYTCFPGESCTIFPGIELTSCPDPMDASISGVKYRECGSLPYMNQPTIPGWPIQLLDADGNFIEEQLTGADGSYAFYDRPKGQYIVKEDGRMGWTPKVPASGQYIVDLAPSQQVERNFGNCPGCSCDSIYMDVVQVPGSSDTCAFVLNATNTGAYCFSKIEVTLSAGTFVDAEQFNGWNVAQIDSQHLVFTPQIAGDDWTQFVFHRWRVAGASMYEITTSTSYNIGMGDVHCDHTFSFVCPPAPGTSCAPQGNFANATIGSMLPTGTALFSMEYGTPTIASQGCNDINGIKLRSEITAPFNSPGDGIRYSTFFGANPLPTFLAGRTYLITFNAAIHSATSGTFNQIFLNLRAANTPQNGYSCSNNCQQIQAVSITGYNCQQFTITFNPTQNYNNLIFAATGQYIDNFEVLWIKLDNICVKELSPPCQTNIQFTQNADCTVTVCAITTGPQPVSYQWCDGRTDACFTTTQTPCVPTTYCVTATCADGTPSTATSSFTVTDNTPPVAVCNPGVGVDLDVNCNYTVSASFVDGGSSDNCQIQSISVSPIILTGCGDHIVTLTVTDFCGNTSSCTMGIQTLEVVPPTVICPSNLTVQGYLDPLGNCKNEVTGIAPQASDNCGLLGVAHTINNGNLILLPDASGTTFGQGATTVTYFAADKCQNTASCSFTVTVECNDCQCPAPGNPGQELVLNGDFSTSGGFTSDYGNSCSGQTEGQLCISANPQSVNPGFQPCTDTLSGTGNMLVVNGATVAGKDVWCQSFTVSPNSNYVFSFYHTSLGASNLAQLQVYVDGNAVGSIAQTPMNTCVWRQHCIVWNSGNNNGSVKICIRDLNLASQGNDFALDLISLKKCSRCVPLPAGAVLWMPMDELGGETSISGIVNGINGIASGLIASGGPNPVAGKVDALMFGMGALWFTGPTPLSSASVNDPSLNFGSGAFTIDAWVNPDLGTQTAPIVEKMVNQTGYALAITGTSAQGNLTLSIGTNNGIQVITGPQVNIGQWNFVAAVVNPPNVTLYVGEDPGGSSSFVSTTHTISAMPTNASNNNPLRIGYNPQNVHWDIAIDELEIFNTALTQTEVKGIWEADIDGKCRSLCECGGFSKLYVRNKNGSVNQSVNCGAQAVNLPCVTGQGYHLVGVFHCDGGECAPDHTINWTLNGPGGPIQNGSFSDNDPFFSIQLLPNWFGQAGNYKLILSGDCGTETCSCEVNLAVNCPNLCPCDAVDKQTFQQNVAKGFAAAISQKHCKACFTPLSVTDCETVSWYLNSTGGPYLGTTYGKKTLCHSFNQAGTYTVVMVVDRLKPDGSSCDYAEYTRTITLTCDEPVDCTDSTLPNARFSDDPVAGRLDSVGSSPGWISGGSHDVYLLQDGTSEDGWSMGITGNFSESGILSSDTPYCVSEMEQGMLTVKLRTMGDPIPGVDVKLGRKPPGGAPSIFLYTGTNIPLPNNPNGSRYPLAELDDLLPFDDNDWYELEIPYNLSDWVELDSCGDDFLGIPARMALFVTNLLDENQASAGPVHDGVVIDHICFRGVQVGTKDISGNNLIRIAPNPTSASFTVTLPAPARPGMRFRITDLAGRMVQELETAPGTEHQTVQAGALSDGLYFLQVMLEGKVLAVEKFVKQ